MSTQAKKHRVIVLGLVALFTFGLCAWNLYRMRLASVEDARFLNEMHRAETNSTESPAGNTNELLKTP